MDSSISYSLNRFGNLITVYDIGGESYKLELYSPHFPTKSSDIIPVYESKADFFVPGRIYSVGLSRYEFTKRIYIKENYSSLVFLDIDQIDTDKKIYLGEEDCKKYGIPSNGKYLVLSQNLGWVDSGLSFDPTTANLVDYPGSSSEIKEMTLLLQGFTRYEKDPSIIRTPSGSLIPQEILMFTMSLSLGHSIPSILGYHGFKKEERLTYSFCNSDNESIVELGGGIKILVSFKDKEEQGISRISLNGLTASELFEITWDDYLGKADIVHTISRTKPLRILGAFINKEGRYWVNPEISRTILDSPNTLELCDSTKWVGI
jgi:hypothetical protein